jgi:hypothetical protein
VVPCGIKASGPDIPLVLYCSVHPSAGTLRPNSVDPSDVLYMSRVARVPNAGFIDSGGTCGVPFDGTSAGHSFFVKRQVCGYSKIPTD